MSARLDALRAEMKKRNIDAFFVPHADRFQSEYTPDSAERLAWISGFTGSAGNAVVTMDKAAFFTDGRYTLQARTQVKDLEVYSTAENQGATPTLTPLAWIEKNLGAGKKFGIDPWLHTPAETKKLKETVEKTGGTLVFVETNPLDAAWKDRPAEPAFPAVPHELEFSGVASKDKRAALVKTLQEKNAAALIIALPEEICWLLNVRGSDIPYNPLPLSYAIAHVDGTVDWFIDPRKTSDDLKEWIGPDVRLHKLEDFTAHIAKLKGKKLWIDPASAPVMAEKTAFDNSCDVYSARSPLQMMKALKNQTEIEGTIRAHIRDGAALTRFLSAIDDGAMLFDEITASDLLEQFRRKNEHFKDLSFDTISGAGGNGAIVHYRSTPETNQPLTAGPIYLVDSGAQYLDGTTDVTRTIAVGKVTAEMKEHVTRVLKGHLQVAMATFDPGTTGDKLDVLARASLKEVGLDYAHGTGHGVGSYLCVHEGPQGISPRATSVALEAGMIVSNEPGYYKEGAYGIRIESLVVVEKRGDKLGFKTLTQAPIDRNLIEPKLLTDEELAWLNDYHAGVRKHLEPLLDGKALAFLQKATAPIAKQPAPSNVVKLFL